MNKTMSQPMPPDQLAALKKAVRAKGGQVRVAELAGVKQSQISKWLNGKNVMADTAQKVYAALGFQCAPFCAGPQRAVSEPVSVNYEQECLRLKHELADQALAVAAKDRELASSERKMAEIERAMLQQQTRIMKAVQIACARAGLTEEEANEIQFAVFNYELVIAEAESGEPVKSHRKAAGE